MIDWLLPFDSLASLYRLLPVSVRVARRRVYVRLVPVRWRNWIYSSLVFPLDWRLWRRDLARSWSSRPPGRRIDQEQWEILRVRDLTSMVVYLPPGPAHPCWDDPSLAGRRWMFPVSMGLLRVDGSMADRRALRRWVVGKVVP